MLLFHSILTFMKYLYQSENQVFNPTRLLVLLHCWVGKDWAGPFFPPAKIFWSFYWSVSLSVYVTLSLYLNTYEWLIQRWFQVFKPNILFVLLHCGVGKDWAGPFFPPSLIFGSFYWSLRLLVYVTLSLYLNINERPIPKRELSFQSNKIVGTSTLLGGKDWAGPFFPSSKMYWSIYLSFSLLNDAALSLHLYTNVWPVQKRESSFQTTIILVLLHCWVGKDWAGPIFPPSKIFLSFFLSFLSFGLCNSLNVSEQFWMTYSKLRIKFSILQVYWYFYFVGWGRFGRPILPPPSIMLGSFNLLFSLSVYVTLWLYLNNFEWPITKRDQVF